jgi:uncharacterized protein YigE (DUF2233 family)
MYRSDFRPVGLYIENSRELTQANTITLTGTPSQIPNFYKKPNGVFFVGNDEAGILETGRFLANRPSAKYATQSGPMLVIDGAIHPAFIVGSTDRKPRNGVGVSSPTEVHFVITQGDGSTFTSLPASFAMAWAATTRSSRWRQSLWALRAGTGPRRRPRPRGLWADHNRR